MAARQPQACIRGFSSNMCSSSPPPRVERASINRSPIVVAQQPRRSRSKSKISFGADEILGAARADVDRSCPRVSSAAVFKTISTPEYRELHQQRIQSRHMQRLASIVAADPCATTAAASSSAAQRPREAAPSPAAIDAYCKFVAKRSSGPLERWCALCGEHADRHTKRRAASPPLLRNLRTHGARGVGK